MVYAIVGSFLEPFVLLTKHQERKIVTSLGTRQEIRIAKKANRLRSQGTARAVLAKNINT